MEKLKLSGLDEQKEVELKVRMFFSYTELLEALQNDKIKKGDVVFLDEDCSFPNSITGITGTERRNLHNLWKILRLRGVYFVNCVLGLKELVVTVKRMGMEEFKRIWLGL